MGNPLSEMVRNRQQPSSAQGQIDENVMASKKPVSVIETGQSSGWTVAIAIQGQIVNPSF